MSGKTLSLPEFQFLAISEMDGRVGVWWFAHSLLQCRSVEQFCITRLDKGGSAENR